MSEPTPLIEGVDHLPQSGIDAIKSVLEQWPGDFNLRPESVWNKKGLTVTIRFDGDVPIDAQPQAVETILHLSTVVQTLVNNLQAERDHRAQLEADRG